MYHLLIEAVEVGIEVVGVVHQVPLATGILTTPSVPFAGEVNPLGVSELVAHEVEVASIDGGGSNKANHLVEGDTTVHHISRVSVLEVPIHISVNESEDDSLVSDECLVVALGIRDRLLVLASVGHLVEDMPCLPVFVAHFLDVLYPEVGYAHGEAIVKAHAAILDGTSESGHAGHLLGDSNRLGLHLVNEFVRQGEVHDSVAVLVHIVVGTISVEVLAQAVAEVNHRGNAVEAEAVEVVFVEPILAVGEQEMEHLGLSVVEAEAVPRGVLAASAVVEVLIARAVEASESLQFVLHGVGMHQVHDNC